METNTQEKRHQAVTNAMERKERTPGDESTAFYCFRNDVAQPVRDLFLENYNVINFGYEIFSKACDIIANIDISEITNDNAEDIINEAEPASVYTSDRLEYLNIWNEDEISDIMKEYSIDSISTACAVWYDQQAQNAARLLRDYIIGSTTEPQSH